MLVSLSTDHYSSTVRKNQVPRSCFHNFVFTLIRLLGIGILGFQGSAWGACAGDTSVTTALVAAQTNNTWLCSYTITNTGSISLNNANGWALTNAGNIDTFTNNGTISSSNATSTYGLNNGDGFTISSLVNTGTISSGNVGLRNAGNSTITSLNNSGTISGANKGIGNTSGTLVTLVNSGTISSSAGSGVYIQTASGVASIGTITNTGSIIGATAGINNVNATLDTLNNKQGAGNVNGALTYTGVLPTNYNIIIGSTTTYGKLAATSVSGTTTFGISNLSTTSSSILNTTLSAVLSGVTSAQLGLGNATTYYSTSNDYWYTLTATDLVNNIWSLTVTCYGSSCGTSIGAGVTVGLANLSTTSKPVLAGGTLLLLNGDQSSLAFSVTGASVIQNPSSGSATLSGVFSGPGSLTFTGSGMTVLTGTNTYSGGTTVSGGTLQGNTLSLQGTIINNSQVVFDQSSTGTYSGVMSGTGSLTKQGNGILVLTGANTYSGGTTVSGGTLSVAGSSPTGTGDVNVNAGGTLMGTGTINGKITVAGILKPGNSPGYLASTGNVTMNNASTYQQDIAGTAQASSSTPVGTTGYYSALNIRGGQFVINSGAALTPRLSNLFATNETGYGSTPYTPVLGDRFRIITADGGISGKFSSVTQPAELTAGTQFLPFYNMAGSNSLDLAVIPTSYKTTIATASGNKNAQSVGSALDRMVAAAQSGTSTAAQDQLLYAGSTKTAASLAGYAQSLAGEVYPAAIAVITQTTQRVQQAVLSRLGDTMGLGLPSTMTSPTGNTGLISTTNTALSGGVASSAVSSNPAVNPNAEAKSFSNGNVWGDLAYQYGNRSSDSNSGGWNSNLYQLVFGSDFFTSNGMKIGGGLALSSTTLNQTYGSGTIQQGSLFAYGKMPVQEFVVDAMASFGLNNSELSRGDVTGLSSGFRSKSVSGNDAMVSLGLSRPFDTDSIRITPFARVTWQIVTQNGVNEGIAASALSVNSYTGNGVRGMLGVAAGSKVSDPMTEQYTYRAYVAVGADSSGVLNPSMNASLAGLSTNINTPNAGTTFVQAGLYSTAKFADNAYAYAGLSGEARSGQMLGAVNAGIRLQF